jgi:hypothetical protein
VHASPPVYSEKLVVGMPSATLTPLESKACSCTKLMYDVPPVLAILTDETGAHDGGGSDGSKDGDCDVVVLAVADGDADVEGDVVVLRPAVGDTDGDGAAEVLSGDEALLNGGDAVADGDGDKERLGEEVAEENADADSEGDAEGDLVSEDASDDDTLEESVRDTKPDTVPPTLVDTLADALTAAADAEALGDGVIGSVGQMARMTQSLSSET